MCPYVNKRFKSESTDRQTHTLAGVTDSITSTADIGGNKTTQNPLKGNLKKMAQFHFTGYKTEKKQYIFNYECLFG